CRHGSGQDSQVAAERPALEILHVELDHLVEREMVAAANLPQPGNSWRRLQAPQMPRLVEFKLVGQSRARPNQAHLAVYHVDQLRQLVDAEATEPTAHGGYA